MSRLVVRLGLVLAGLLLTAPTGHAQVVPTRIVSDSVTAVTVPTESAGNTTLTIEFTSTKPVDNVYTFVKNRRTGEISSDWFVYDNVTSGTVTQVLEGYSKVGDKLEVERIYSFTDGTSQLIETIVVVQQG